MAGVITFCLNRYSFREDWCDSLLIAPIWQEFVKPEYLPNGYGFDDPSKYKTRELNGILSLWRHLQKKGEIPFKFHSAWLNQQHEEPQYPAAVFSRLQALGPIRSPSISQINNDDIPTSNESMRDVRKAARSDDGIDPEDAGGSDTAVTLNAQNQSSEADGQDEESSQLETASQVTEVEQPVTIQNGPYIKRKVVVSESEYRDGPPRMSSGTLRLREFTPLNQLDSSRTLAGSSVEDTPVPRNRARRENGIEPHAT